MRLALLTAAAVCCLAASAGNPALQFHQGENYTVIDWESVDAIRFDAKARTYNVSLVTGETKTLSFDTGDVSSCVTTPKIELWTDEYMYEIPDKINFKPGQFVMQALGQGEDYEGTPVNIRGRGNWTWYWSPKKSYRLKFNKKQSLLGLPSGKSYVLVPNYNDPSLMVFAVACKLSEWLDMPFTPQTRMVDVDFNGRYRGAYMLTNKVGLNAGSVTVDEATSVMWEMDLNDEGEEIMTSPIYNIPLLIVDPDDMDEERMNAWLADYNAMEQAVSEGRAPEVIDIDQFVRYYLINETFRNEEIGHPKSVKLYKTEGGLYHFGPIWDFDYCAGIIYGNNIHFSLNRVDGKVVGANELFRKILEHPEAKPLLQSYCRQITAMLPDMLDFIDAYAAEIESAGVRNNRLYPTLNTWTEQPERFKAWLTRRCEILETLWDEP